MNTHAACGVTVVGTLNIDQVWQVPMLPRRGQTLVASGSERQFGGKGGNQAIAAARQGARVRIVGAVADDTDGQSYREQLQREGVDITHVMLVPNVSTGSAHVYVDPCGENLIVVDRGANARVPLAALEPAVMGADILLVQLECEPALTTEALRLGDACSVPSILNASPVQPAFVWGQHPVHTVIVNEHECAEWFRVLPQELYAGPDARRRELLERHRVQHLVITRGAEATFHLSIDAKHAVSTYPVMPRDTVGAGDTFAGVLATELARGENWEAALWRANVAAALSTLAVGAQSAMPTRRDVDAAVNRSVAQVTAGFK